MLTKKIAKAYAVLAIMLDNLNEEEKDIGSRFTIQPYMNGREQGFAVMNYDAPGYPKVAFAECRGSDQIVVYTGFNVDFSSGGNVASEETYKKAKYFDSEQYVAAAHEALNHLQVEHCLGSP